MGAGATAFVGRERELELLERAWTRATERVGGLILLTGDPGMGKSRLLEAFMTRRREQGHPIWLGQCWEAGGAPTYWPWTQALRSLARALGHDRLRERLGPRVAFLEAVLPDLSSGTGSVGATEDPDQARFQVFDAVGELLSDAAYDAPVCIALEDLHAADEASLLLLEFLARANPALIIGTYREKEAARRPVGTTLARVARRATVLPVQPLQEDHVARLLEATWGRPPAPELVTRLCRSSEGNPLFVTELERRWRAQPQSAPTRAQTEPLDVPPGIEATIAEHLSELDAQTREVLEAAAVLGRDFDTGMLSGLLELTDEEVLAGVEAGCKADLLLQTGPDAFRFAHFMHRAVIYQGIAAARRSQLHLRVTDILRATSGSETAPWSTLAHHYFAAGHPARDQAIEAAVEAADTAMRRRAFADAAALLSQACDVLESTPDAGSKRRLELLLRLAQAQMDAGDPERGRQTCERAVELARESSDRIALARAALTYGSVFELGIINPRLIALLEEALSALGEHEPTLRAQILGRHAAALQPAADPSQPIQEARDAIALARRTGDKRVLLATIRSAVSAMMDLGDPAERIVLSQEHVDLALELGEPGETMRGHLRLIVDALELGDVSRADAHLEVLTRVADELALPHFQWLAYGLHAVRALMEGRFKAAGRWEEQMRLYAERTGDSNVPITITSYELGAIRLRREDERLLERIEEVGTNALGTTWGPGFLLTLRASTLARLHRGEEARALLSESMVRSVLMGGDPMAVCCLGEVATAASDVELAARVLEVLEPRRGRFVSWGVLGLSWDGPIDRVLGLLEASLGRAEAAATSFQAATDACRRLDTPLHLQVVEDDRARALAGLEVEPSGPAPAADVPPEATSEPLALQREGETWTLTGTDPKLSFKDTRGMGMLARLLDEPGREFHVLDLSGSPDAPSSDAGPILDEQARTAYRRRAEHLRSELAEAEAWNDTGRAQKARVELDALSRELAAAVGLGGRSRKMQSSVERARVNVQRRIKDAIRRITEQDEVVGRHLARSVRTGTYCAYEPD